MAYHCIQFKDELDVLKYFWLTEREHILKKIQCSIVITKCDKSATKLKDLANVEFSNRNFDHAKDMYFAAMMTATNNSKVYGIACANMSACLFEAEVWMAAINLIDIALNTVYPNALRPKLYIRKIKAFMKMSDNINAAKTASELQHFIDTCEFSQDKRNGFLKLSSEAFSVVVDTFYTDPDLLVLPDMDENPNIPNVSRKAQLCINEKYGRHIIAKDVIEQGECILIEKPFAAVGLVRCAYCLDNLEGSFLPCKNCRLTVYCSESCMVSDEIIHKWECSLFQNESLYNIDIKVRLAYRIFLKRIEAGFEMNAQYNVHSSPDTFFNFTKLHKPALEENIKKGIIFDYANECCIIMAQLSQNKHFMTWIKNKTNGIYGDILTIGKDLLEFSLICDCNSAGAPVDVPNAEILLSWSFFNHSCANNTKDINIHSKRVLKALHTIMPGEQIYISYIEQEDEMSNSAKQEKLLSKWNFKCECQICVSNTKQVGNYICPKCKSSDTDIDVKLKCNVCHGVTVFPFEKVLQMTSFADKIGNEGNTDNELAYAMLTLGNGIEINPESDIGHHIYLEVVNDKLKTGDLKNIEKYLPHLRNLRKGNVMYQKYNINMYRNLMIYTKSVYFSSSRFSPQLDMSTINCLVDHLNFLTIYFNFYLPFEPFLKGISDIKAYFSIQQQNLQFQETIEWTE